jgi:hypothetical protein
MALIDKLNLLHIFMFLLFIIGLLLLITAFSAYSKIGPGCTSKSLKTKLRWAIGLGTTFVTMSIGYTVCVTKKGGKCQFVPSNLKIYTMLGLLVGMGGGLLVLAISIKKELSSPSCNVDLGVTPEILIGLAIAQIVLPILYIIWILYSRRTKKVRIVDEEPESDESLALEAQSKRSATNTRRLARYNKTIHQKSAELDQVRDRIEIFKEHKKNPSQKDLASQDRLVREIANAQQSKKGVGSTTDDSSVGISSTSSNSNPSSSSVGSGGFNVSGIGSDEDGKASF